METLLFVITLLAFTGCHGLEDEPEIRLDAGDVFGSMATEGGMATMYTAANQTDRIQDLYSVVILKCMAEDEVTQLFEPLADDDCQIEKIMCSDLLVQLEMSIWSEDALSRVREVPGVAWVQEVYNVSVDTHFWGKDRINQRNLPLDNLYSPVCEFPDYIGYYEWQKVRATYRICPQKPNIFIVDTGIAYNHVEFEGRAKYHFDYYNGGGWDYYGHGTHVAGIAGGKTYGVARNANLWSVRVFNANGYGTSTSVQQGLLSILLNAKKPGVINMSFGFFNNDLHGSALIDAIQNFHDIVAVASAGNNNFLASYKWPAMMESVVTVGATDSFDYKASFSNYGPSVNIFAPGVSIYSAYSTSQFTTSSYDYLSGTSMAAPFVAGAAALIKENLPYLRAREVAIALVYNSSKNKVLLHNGTPNNHVVYACIPNEYVYYVNYYSGSYWSYY